MGWTWQVEGWVPGGDDDIYPDFSWSVFYRGESVIRAIVCALKCRKNKIGCIRIIWRPNH